MTIIGNKIIQSHCDFIWLVTATNTLQSIDYTKLSMHFIEIVLADTHTEYKMLSLIW